MKEKSAPSRVHEMYIKRENEEQRRSEQARRARAQQQPNKIRGSAQKHLFSQLGDTRSGDSHVHHTDKQVRGSPKTSPTMKVSARNVQSNASNASIDTFL